MTFHGTWYRSPVRLQLWKSVLELSFLVWDPLLSMKKKAETTCQHQFNGFWELHSQAWTEMGMHQWFNALCFYYSSDSERSTCRKCAFADRRKTNTQVTESSCVSYTFDLTLSFLFNSFVDSTDDFGLKSNKSEMFLPLSMWLPITGIQYDECALITSCSVLNSHSELNWLLQQFSAALLDS